MMKISKNQAKDIASEIVESAIRASKSFFKADVDFAAKVFLSDYDRDSQKEIMSELYKNHDYISISSAQRCEIMLDRFEKRRSELKARFNLDELEI